MPNALVSLFVSRLDLPWIWTRADELGGFGDYFSWIPGVFAGFGAADLYGFDWKPKPAFYSVQQTL